MTSHDPSKELDIDDVFSAPPPPSLGGLSISSVPSKCFDSWDFGSSDSLSSDEVHAVMIALAAEQQDSEHLWRNHNNNGGSGSIIGDDDDSDDSDGFSSKVKQKLPPPPDLERDVAIQHLPCHESTQILVTLGGKMTKYGTPSKRNICQDTPQNPMQISSRLQSLPPIGDHNDNNNDQNTTGRSKRASFTSIMENRQTQSAREVSVHPLTCDQDTQFVVTIPSTSETKLQRPTLGARFLSIKPRTREGMMKKNTMIQSVPVLAVGKDRRPCLSKHRQVAARFNDGKQLSQLHLQVDF